MVVGGVVFVGVNSGCVASLSVVLVKLLWAHGECLGTRSR